MKKLTRHQILTLLRSILRGIRRYHGTLERQRHAGQATTPELDDVILAGLTSAYTLGLEHGRGRSLKNHDQISSYLERDFTQKLLGHTGDTFVHHLVGPNHDDYPPSL